MRHLRTILERKSAHSSDAPVVVTVGSFDGVHRGHVRILEHVFDAARPKGTSTVVSFDPHPRAVLGGEAPPALTTLEERARICVDLGADRFTVIEFDSEVAGMSPATYAREILVGDLNASVVVIGHDHRFGHGASGDAELLVELGRDLGFDVIEVDAVLEDGIAISSSRIRRHVGRGEVGRAADLLGRRFSLAGRVGHGDGRGRSIGYPTANLMDIPTGKLTPVDGVYAVFVTGERLRGTHRGMMNIGTRPTFDGTTRHLEVHILDVDLDLYESELRVEFALRIREERKFDSVEALVSQLKHDEARCRAALSDRGVHKRLR